MSHVSSHVGNDARPSERRAYARQSVQSLAYVELGDGNGGVVLNISEAGMAVQAIMSLLDDDLPCVRVQLSHAKKAIEVGARIVWSSDLRTVVGLKFTDQPEEVRNLIREWVSLESKEFSEKTISPIEKTRAAAGARSVSRVQDPISAQPTRGNRRTGENQTDSGKIRQSRPFSRETPHVPIASVPLAATASTTGISPTASRFEESRRAIAPGKSGFGAPKKWPWVLGTLALVALFAAGFFEVQGERSVAPREIKSKASIDSKLGLKLESTGTDWRLSWNPNAPAVLNATKGQLFVTDGALHKTVELDASDFHGGTIIYSPLTSDVVWKLQVTPTDGSSEEITESVRTVSAPSSNTARSLAPDALPSAPVIPPGPGDWGSQRESKPEIKRNLQQPHGRTDHSDGKSLASTVAAAPAANRRVAPLASAARPLAKSLPSNPTLTARVTTPALPSVAIRVPESVPVIPTRPSETESFGKVAKTVGRGGLFQAAQLLVNVNPSYPTSAREDGISGSVEVRFKIGMDGSVHDILVVKGPPILAQAAIEAVGVRKYKPARVDGVPSETEASAIFDFKLN
jgi:TonB family protein